MINSKSLLAKYESIYKGFYGGGAVIAPSKIDSTITPSGFKSPSYEVTIKNPNAPKLLKIWNHPSYAKSEKQAKAQAMFRYSELFKDSSNLNKPVTLIMKELYNSKSVTINIKEA